MREVAFAIVGSWLYAGIIAVLEPFIGPAGATFLFGYFVVAIVDLWRCWASVRGVAANPLELTVAVLLLFPIGSLLWLPWDVARLLHPRSNRWA